LLAQEIVANRLSNQVDLLLNDISQELLRRHGKLTIEIVSVHDLSTKVKEYVAELLKTETGAKTTQINERRDPSLKGGLIARTPDLELNLSIAGKLKQLEVL
jgi:F0F1-type ATP synthase delta subunit